MMKLAASLHLSTKLGAIFLLSLLLGLPLLMIRGTIGERQERHKQVVGEIAQAWGAEQRLLGPLLVVPYSVALTDDQGKRLTQTRSAIFLPDHLTLQVQAEPEVRYRGLFEAVVYRSKIHLEGQLAAPNLADFKGFQVYDDRQILWQDAFIVLGIKDMRSLKGGLTMTVGGKPLDLAPGSRLLDLIADGVHAPLGRLPASSPLAFAMDWDLNGSQAFEVVPVGKTTLVTMASPWPSPSFTGAYLPEKRRVEAGGFEAQWNLSYFGRSYPQVIDASQHLPELKTAMDASKFGVAFYQPIDAYQQTERALKYGFLIILLTFLSYFLFDVQAGLRLHVIPYGLVGLALAVFFLLLLALAEHMGFTKAYALAALAVNAQVSLYSLHILKTRRRALSMSLLMGGLYAYLYFMLQLEDYALLLGALTLFAILGGLMYATRHFDWSEGGSVPAPPTN